MTNFVITLKWVLLVITLTGVCADDTHGIEKRDTNSDSKKIVCYYTNWSVYRPGTAKFTPQNINPYLCTHLIYAFGGLDKENGLRPYDKYQDIEQGGYAKFTGLKTYNKNLKTMLAIGGWNEGSSRFSNLVADEDRRATFVKNVVKFLRQNNFDGLDLDWEYPAFRDGSKPADKENYAALVKELREEFEKEASKTGRPRLLLTMAVPAGIEYIDKGYDIPKLNKYLDFMNILSYDYHSAYEPNVNHHSPLYSLQEESEYNFDAQLTIDYTVQHYLKKGADPEKLVLGIPTYGRSYTLFNSESTDLGSPADGPGEQGEATREKGYLAYYEICSNVAANDEWKVVQTKKSAMGPYAYRGNQWVGYDDTDIVKVKANYVNEKGLGGIMFWSIDNDDFRGKCHGKQYPLIETGKEAMLASSGVSTKTLNTASTEEKRIKLGTRKQRPKHHTTTGKPQSTTTKSTTTTTSLNPLSTPEPPTTPDPGTDFVCKEEGFFPHPRDCKKYFWCLDSGPSNLGIVAHQFTCPSGLLFNKAADSCDYSRNVICNKKDKSTTTTTVKTTSGSLNVKQSTVAPTTTTTTTTTETPSSEIEYEEQEDVESEEDPKAIKQLITLIKKLGGINELEKQLKLADGAKEVTTPAISKNLYNKVFSNPTAARFRYQHRNAPAGQQNEDPSSNEDVPYRKEKPQYVTIQRSRPLKNIAQDTEDSGTANAKAIQPSRNTEEDYEDIIPEEEMTTTKYSSLSRSRMATDSRPSTLKYVVLERNRPDKSTTDEGESTSESSLPSTQKYITLIRNRTNNSITTSGDFSESRTESGSPQHTSRSSTQANEPLTEKSREKKEDTEIITTTISSSSTDHFQITHDRGNNTADPEAADVHHVSNVFAGNASMHTLDIIKNDSKTEAKSPTIKHRLSAENGTVLPNMYSSSTEGNVQYTVPHGTTRFLSNENFNKNKILTEMAYSPATEESQLNFYDRYSENKYKPEHSETRGEPVHSKTNSRNNSRFLKSPESENKRHSKDKDKVIDPYNYITEKSPLKDSPVYIVQKTNENQIEFEVRIRHQTDKPSSKQESAKRLSPSHEEYQTRGKKKFADSLKDANNLHTEYTTENKASKTDKSILEGRHAQVYYSSPVATESSRYVTTFNPRILNRGSIKAKNSLSKAEIKELVDLDGPKSKPVNKIEETYYNSSPTIKNNFTPKEKIKEMFIESTDNFGFSKIYVIPNDFSDRFYDEATDQLNEAKEEFIAVSKYKDVNLNDVFRVSETKYSDEGTRHTYSVGEKSTPEKNHHKLSANTANMELPTRLRSNFRRNNQIQRTRFTQPTTTTTTTTEYSDVSKLSSRFRRRKVRPENRSINTARNENFLPLTEIETSTLTRHKNYDISHRGTSLVSDYLPIPAPFFQENQTHHDELITDNINSQDLQIQSISPPKSNNNNDDISDLADPAVAAIAHLKTLPPASSQITFSRAPIQSLITYTNEPLGQYNKIKSTFRTTTAVPINEKKISYRRGPSKLLARTTTTTQLPSLQDIYNDYHDTDAEYHADPVDIPISGKVRIHSDGYIECLDMGNFPHPFSCRKFISCAKMEYDSLLGWEYTCPKGLSFDPIGGICNWAAGLGCKD